MSTRKHGINVQYLYDKMFQPAFGCAQHPKAGRNTQHLLGPDIEKRKICYGMVLRQRKYTYKERDREKIHSKRETETAHLQFVKSVKQQRVLSCMPKYQVRGRNKCLFPSSAFLLQSKLICSTSYSILD